MPDAGWYPDPADPTAVRYWDGAAWTENVAVAAPSAPASAPAPAAPTAPTAPTAPPAVPAAPVSGGWGAAPEPPAWGSAPQPPAWGAAPGDPAAFTPAPYSPPRRSAGATIAKVVVALLVLGAIGGGVYWFVGREDTTDVALGDVQSWFTKSGLQCGGMAPLDTRDAAAKTVRQGDGLSDSNRSTLADAIERQSADATIGLVTCGALQGAPDPTTTVLVFVAASGSNKQALLAVVDEGYGHVDDLETTGIAVLQDHRPFGDTNDAAKVQACKVELRTIRTAVEAYKGNTGAYPPDLATLAAPGPNQFLQEAPKPADWSYVPATGAVTPLAGGTYTPSVAASCS